MLVVDPPVLPRANLSYQIIRDFLCTICLDVAKETCSSCCVLEVPCLANLSALSFPRISQCPGIQSGWAKLVSIDRQLA